jgi:hypothetical protein
MSSIMRKSGGVVSAYKLQSSRWRHAQHSRCRRSMVPVPSLDALLHVVRFDKVALVGATITAADY